MKFLITNDDGIYADGLKILVKAAKKYGDVVVVAPKVEQSGKSHSIRIREDMEFYQVDDIIPGVKSYYLDSTPVDCVRIAHHYLKLEFDIVLSGVNSGHNLGEDIIYSGTTAAATHGAMLGYRSAAFSTEFGQVNDIEKELDEAFKFMFDNKLLDKWPLFNINVPCNSKGFKFSAQGNTHYTNEFIPNNHDNVKYLKCVGRPTPTPDPILHSDVQLTFEGYTTFTPLRYNRTNAEILEKLLK